MTAARDEIDHVASDLGAHAIDRRRQVSDENMDVVVGGIDAQPCRRNSGAREVLLPLGKQRGLAETGPGVYEEHARAGGYAKARQQARALHPARAGARRGELRGEENRIRLARSYRGRAGIACHLEPSPETLGAVPSARRYPRRKTLSSQGRTDHDDTYFRRK